jgi:hypothetical protein
MAAGGVSDWKAVGVAAGVGAVTGGIGGVAAKFAAKGAISAGEAAMATSAAGGLAAATGKNVEAGLKGETVTVAEVAVSAGTGAVGSAVGGKLATKLVGKAEKVAASSDNVVSNIGANTLDAIRQGGPAGAATAGASEGVQKTADLATGVAGKKIENATK